jgi:hypothetical protein
MAFTKRGKGSKAKQGPVYQAKWSEEYNTWQVGQRGKPRDLVADIYNIGVWGGSDPQWTVEIYTSPSTRGNPGEIAAQLGPFKTTALAIQAFGAFINRPPKWFSRKHALE